jgi:preprotein translocase subunit SecE
MATETKEQNAAQEPEEAKAPQQAAVQESPGEVRTLGLMRWVQLTVLVVFLFLIWLLNHLATLVWEMFAQPDPAVISIGSIVVSGIVAWRLYSHVDVKRWMTDVIGELTKVTWPMRKETSAATVVVIIASLIAAAILGAFDTAWSAITDLIYEV